MRKMKWAKYLCLFLVLFVGACKNKMSSQDEDFVEKKKWTFLFYCDEDFTPPFPRFEDFYIAMSSGEDVNVLGMRDCYNGPATYWYLEEHFERTLLKELGEVNMGSYETLYDFLAYAKVNYPAERTILSLYDHGFGWVGACWDYSNGHDWLSPDDIQRALELAGGVDLIIFKACMMGAVETVYELRGLTDIYIASENRTTYWFFNDPMKDVSRILNETPDISNEALGEAIVGLIWNNSNNDYQMQFDLTMSSVYVEKMDTLVQAVDELSLAYLNNQEVFCSIMDSVFYKIQTYRNHCMDLYDFAKQFLKFETDSLIRTKLFKVQECLKKSINAECHGINMEGSEGLSIYFPYPDSMAYNPFYSDQEFNLDFTQRTHWDELLFNYFENTHRQIVLSIPELPESMEMDHQGRK